ncbi:hypothetical protein ACFQZ4_21840 [Catellatospora coxensis]
MASGSPGCAHSGASAASSLASCQLPSAAWRPASQSKARLTPGRASAPRSSSWASRKQVTSTDGILPRWVANQPPPSACPASAAARMSSAGETPVRRYDRRARSTGSPFFTTNPIAASRSTTVIEGTCPVTVRPHQVGQGQQNGRVK